MNPVYAFLKIEKCFRHHSALQIFLKIKEIGQFENALNGTFLHHLLYYLPLNNTFYEACTRGTVMLHHHLMGWMCWINTVGKRCHDDKIHDEFPGGSYASGSLVSFYFVSSYHILPLGENWLGQSYHDYYYSFILVRSCHFKVRSFLDWKTK